MTNWKIYKLSEVAIISTGFPFAGEKYAKEGIRVVRGDNVTIGALRWDNDKLKCWNEPFVRANEFSLMNGDIVVGMDGSRVGLNRAQVKETDLPLLLAQRVACIRHNEKTTQDFLYYQIFSERFVKYIKQVQTGTSIPHVSLKQIGGFEISLPSLEEQRRIAGILGAIDDKIENNRRINTNLELQAQALYKQWFVDFEFPNEEGKPYKSSGGKMVDSEIGPIPDGWSVGTLSDLADVTMGQSPNGKSFNENGDGIVFYQGRTEFSVRYPSIRLYTTEPTRYAEPMSVLLSVRAPVGDINIATQRCCIGRGVASIKSKTDDNAYMYCCLKELRLQLDQYNGEGTVFGSINRKELEGLSLCVPKEEVITLFNNSILGMDKQMLNLFQQTQNLATLRDTLLPKLMNGEIKITE
ncbi:MAG: restriction endonuclease subunit S [Alistipes sp.]|nr:restriction endonuclease subunit S [Alistipes sp.]